MEIKISQQINREYKQTIRCEYFWIGLIDFMLKGKSLLDFTNLFSPSKYKSNDKNIFLIY